MLYLRGITVFKTHRLGVPGCGSFEKLDIGDLKVLAFVFEMRYNVGNITCNRRNRYEAISAFGKTGTFAFL